MKNKQLPTTTDIVKQLGCDYKAFYNLINLLNIKSAKTGFNRAGNRYTLWDKNTINLIEEYLSQDLDEELQREGW